jgi:hypothetical protein
MFAFEIVYLIKQLLAHRTRSNFYSHTSDVRPLLDKSHVVKVVTLDDLSMVVL